MIGLIAPSLSTVRLWRDNTKVPENISPWLSTIADVEGLSFTGLILLPNWDERPSNYEILARARGRIIRVAPDPEEEAQAQREAFDEALRTVQTLNAGLRPTSVPGDVLRDRIIDRLDQISPVERDTDAILDRAASGLPVAVYDAMTADERAHLSSLIHMNDRRAFTQYAEALRVRYSDTTADEDVAAQLLRNRVAQVVDFVGGENRHILESLPARDLDRLVIMVQQINLARYNQTERVELIVQFHDYWNAMRRAWAESQWTSANDAQPRDTAQPRPARTSIPFADIFRPRRPSRLREDDL